MKTKRGRTLAVKRLLADKTGLSANSSCIGRPIRKKIPNLVINPPGKKR